ncbi:MAG TPA: anaerobic ribonucleoside-triphosphate reductase activating protein [Anaerolineaceae bacterium]|nr:anaerobic ribonucleoside-triphosphate reductase activating protein [Anaerolineaceae bacterium]
MIVGGFQKFSLMDYPGKTCAIIFTRGCTFRCRYCHNPELVIPEQYASRIPLRTIFEFLETRRGKLDAVEITGGEPTQHADLIVVIRSIKDMGFLVKLDSNGSRPEVLKEIINQKLVDYLAMDIKAPLGSYSRIMGWQVPASALRQSIHLIMNSGVDYEFRTTLIKSLISRNDLREIAKTIHGAKKYFLQKFIPLNLVDNHCAHEVSYSDKELKEFAQELMQYVEFCGVR